MMFHNRSKTRECGSFDKHFCNKYEGKFPSDIEELMAVPYIGPYCAGAILCFAFEHCAPMVDSNVDRIVSRVFMGLLRTRPTTKAIFRGLLVVFFEVLLNHTFLFITILLMNRSALRFVGQEHKH